MERIHSEDQVSIGEDNAEILQGGYESDEVDSAPLPDPADYFTTNGLTKLAVGSREYEMVRLSFLEYLGRHAEETSVVAVHKNISTSSAKRARLDAFMTFGKAMGRKYGGKANIRMPWYVGGSKEEINGIVSHGFSRCSDGSGMAQEGISTSTVYTWKIKNFTKLTAKELKSDAFVVAGYKWQLITYPKRKEVADGYLSLYLEVADFSTLPDGWSRDIESFSITVVNQIHPRGSVEKSTKHRFDEQEPNWGFRKFLPLTDIHDPARGYLLDDTLVVQVRASVSAESLSILLEKSKNLLAELSSTNTTQSLISSNEISEPSIPLNPQSLEDYLALSLEDIDQANAFDKIERIALKLVKHSSNSLEITILKGLVSRLETFKDLVPATKSTLESAKADRLSLSGKIEDVGMRVDQGQELLITLDTNFSNLAAEEMELEAEILRLTIQKEELVIRKNSMVLELGKANKRVSKDLTKWRKIGKETEKADTHWLQTREKLAQLNLSWKLFKQNLEECQKSD